ncbi:MAG TPA: hypothetical protein VK601_17780, partial [Kofleriaceae bacterium]|nr:hypothetical protein [Kofleriaceae bacterium]
AGKPVALLRIPKAAPALQPVIGRDARVRSDGLGVTLAVNVPISGYRSGIAGGIVISTPVDLGAVRHALEAHSYAASLTGLGGELMLADAHGESGGPPVVLPVPSMGAWTGAAKLIATPKRATGLGWSVPARYMSGGLAALLLLGFVASLGRRPRA